MIKWMRQINTTQNCVKKKKKKKKKKRKKIEKKLFIRQFNFNQSTSFKQKPIAFKQGRRYNSAQGFC